MFQLSTYITREGSDSERELNILSLCCASLFFYARTLQKAHWAVASEHREPMTTATPTQRVVKYEFTF